MAHTIHIKCSNSVRKSVCFIPNGGDINDILTMAEEDGEYWFTIGYYKSMKTAKAAAARKMAKFGYFFDAEELKALTME